MSLLIINESKFLNNLTNWYVRKSLRWISPLDLAGIDYIRILDQAPESTLHSSKLERFAIQNGFTVNGLYYRKTNNNKAYILLFSKDIYYPIPNIAFFSPLPIFRITKILAHEIGHHLIATRGFIFSSDENYPDYNLKPLYEEEMSDRYAFEVTKKMSKSFFYKSCVSMMNFFSDWYYGKAAAEYDNNSYKKAAELWYKSFLLNSERSETVEWYWHSIEKWKSQNNDWQVV